MPQEKLGRQHQERDEQQKLMQPSLRSRTLAGAVEQVPVGVAAQQQHLKKKHAGDPYGGGPAKPRQDVLADDQLDLKQQQRAKKNGEAEDQHGRFGLWLSNVNYRVSRLDYLAVGAICSGCCAGGQRAASVKGSWRWRKETTCASRTPFQQ